MFRQIQLFIQAAVCAVLPMVSQMVLAESYPDRPITLVVPYGTGGTSDLSARALADIAAKYIGQPIIVVNRGGASGIVGSKFVLDSANDGYTLLLARVGAQAIAPALLPMTQYKWDSFTMIGLLEQDAYVCVVNANGSYKTFGDLTRALKDQGKKLTYATTGPADVTNVMPELIFRELGLPPNAAVRASYKGGGALALAVLSKEVDFSCNGLAGFLGGIRGGTLRPLVVSTPVRMAEAPDAPSAAEVGMPALEKLTGWGALYGPASLPKEVLAKWNEVLAKVKNDPAWIDRVKKRAAIPAIDTMSKAEEHSFFKDQYEFYLSLAPNLGLKH